MNPLTASDQIRASLYPESQAGGFSSVDGTMEFYTRVNSLLRPEMCVLDYGAGRGEWMRDPVTYRRQLRDLRGKVRQVIGADIDTAVIANGSVDTPIVCPDAKSIPLEDATVDLIVSDYTFEHIDYPDEISSEMARVLKPGGWICARTPNRWGYIAIGASVIPNVGHVRMLRTLQPTRESQDVFPTRYRLNTRRALRLYFPVDMFDHHTYYWASDPDYFGNSLVLARVIKLALEHLPRVMMPNVFVFLRKIGETNRSTEWPTADAPPLTKDG